MAQSKTLRTKTGIPGLDDQLQGGFLPGKSILLSGTPGTGKTIFALQYLYNGAAKHKEKGMYISFEEKTQSLRNQAKQFGWNIAALEKKGLLALVHIPTSDIAGNTAKFIINSVKKFGAQRLVIDSLSTLSINIPTTYSKITDVNEFAIKRFMYQFINEVRDLDNTTSLLISQTTDGQLSRDTVSEFVADGIIHITYDALGGEYARSLLIRKMREIKHNEDIHSVEIGTKGIVIHTVNNS